IRTRLANTTERIRFIGCSETVVSFLLQGLFGDSARPEGAGLQLPTADWSRVPPSCMPPISWKVYQSLVNQAVPVPEAPVPCLMRRMEPSPMQNWTTAVCWLPKVYQFGGVVSDQAVARAPQPIQAQEKSRDPLAPFGFPQSVSPKSKVLDVP